MVLSDYQQRLRDKVVEEALPGIVDGTLKVFVERVFDWKDVRIPFPCRNTASN